MIKAKLDEQYPIIEKLEYNFLVNEDIYSLNTLMSLLYDKNFVNFSKNTFYVKEYVIKNLKKYFWNLSDIDQIIDTIDLKISEDVNRYEYLISIKAQYRAFKDKKMIDKLEYELIECFGDTFLIENVNCSYNRDDQRFIDIGKVFKENIYNDKELVTKLKRNIGKYCDYKIKGKIYTIDRSTPKQLTFDTQNIFTEDITLKQTRKIYEKSLNYLYNSIVEVYAEYYYRGLVREVLERYQ